MMAVPFELDDVPAERRSRSAEQARAAEQARLMRLTPLERILVALELGQRDLELRRRYLAAREAEPS